MLILMIKETVIGIREVSHSLRLQTGKAVISTDFVWLSTCLPFALLHEF